MLVLFLATWGRHTNMAATIITQGDVLTEAGREEEQPISPFVLPKLQGFEMWLLQFFTCRSQTWMVSSVLRA